MPIEVEPKDVFEKVVFSRAIIDDEASMNDLTLLSGWDLRTFSSRKRIPLDELNATTSGSWTTKLGRWLPGSLTSLTSMLRDSKYFT